MTDDKYVDLLYKIKLLSQKRLLEWKIEKDEKSFSVALGTGSVTVFVEPNLKRLPADAPIAGAVF